MDLREKLAGIAAKIPVVVDDLQTEEATKTALVMPFLRALGYDVFDPTEVVPEFVADVGIKKGEKVDFAILRDGAPVILIECKCAGANLKKYGSQLFRYFSTTDARLGILTDGVYYRVFADLDQPNRLDEIPFLDVDLRRLEDEHVTTLEHLAKAEFDVQAVLEQAENLRLASQLSSQLREHLDAPSDRFVRFLVEPVHSGRLTGGVIEKYRPLVGMAVKKHVSNLVADRLRRAIDQTTEETGRTVDTQPDPVDEPPKKNDEVVTTVEELEGFFTIKAMLRGVVDPERIHFRDVRSYFGVLLDNNNRKPICRLWLNGGRKYLGVFDTGDGEERIAIDCVDNLWQHEDRLKKSLELAMAK